MITSKTVGKCLVGACLTAALATASAADSVGTLSRVEGVAGVSQGAQYVKGTEGMKLKEGDRLMVMDGGNAVVTFADGCQYALSDNELLTVGPVSTCASDAAGSYKVDPYSAVSQNPAVAGESFTPAAIEPSTNPADGTYSGVVPSWVPPAGIIGTLVILGATLDTDGDSFRPISISP